MRMIKKLVLFFVFFLLSFSLFSCNKKSEPNQLEIINQYTVNFVTENDTKITPKTITKGGLVDKPNNPIKEGYSFKNWMYENKTWDFNKDKVFQNITLIAQWSINQYDVTFNTMGGSIIKSKTLDYNSNITEFIPVKEGYNFSGWYQSEEYKEKERIETVPAKDITVYAKWTQEEQYEIKLFLDGGLYNGNKNDKEEYYSLKLPMSKFPFVLDDPIKEDNGIYYPFVGWYKDDKYKTKIETLEANDQMIYAKWDYERFYSGYYPQSKVIDINLKNKLSSLEVKDEYSKKIEYNPRSFNNEKFEYVEYENKKYAKWESDFYEFELVEWIKNGHTTYSKYVLDASVWDDSPIYSHNINTPYIKKYINEVVNPIFRDNQLNKRVELLAKETVYKSDYSGFGNDSSRVAYSTDFAKARYNKRYEWETFNSQDYLNNNGFAYYWTDTINSIYDANLVDFKGEIKQYSNYFVFGVRFSLENDI